MADHADMKAHAQTYAGMLSLLKWLTGVSVVIVALVIWLIV